VKTKKKNQKNFNSFIHSINIILDMVFLCTLYIFKGTHTRLMDCGVKKVCEGFKHRMVRASSTVPSRLFLFLCASPRLFFSSAPSSSGLLGGGPLFSFDGSSVRANKWEPKKKEFRAQSENNKKKSREEARTRTRRRRKASRRRRGKN
jgi:hypothetical protein